MCQPGGVSYSDECICCKCNLNLETFLSKQTSTDLLPFYFFSVGCDVVRTLLQGSYVLVQTDSFFLCVWFAGSRGPGEGPQVSRLSGPRALFCSGHKPRLFHCLVPPDAAAPLSGPGEQI